METFLIEMAMKGGPSAIIVSIAVLWIGPKISKLQADVAELKTGKRWIETCKITHEEVNRRFERIENALNGAIFRREE